MSPKRWSVLLSAVTVVVAIGVAGCPPTTPPTAVLAGTWTLTPATSPNPNLTSVELNFDSSGNLVSVTYVFNNASATRTLADTETSVSGTAVSIASTTAGFTFEFDGTLNAANTVVDGDSSFTLVIGNTTINAPSGPATLTKKGTVTGNAANGQTLYNAECLACHPTPSSVKAGASLLVPNVDLAVIHPAMAGIILTEQESADLQAFLATQ